MSQLPDRYLVRVVYALPERQVQIEVTVTAGATVADAIARSGLPEMFPGLAPVDCAIFGKSAALSEPVKPGDRVEILRPLQIDPKESRRQAAARSRRDSAPPR